MFSTLITNLATLIVTVRRNALSSLMTTLMIIIIIVTYSARGNIATWMEKNPSPEQKVERIERSQQSDKKIDATLRKDMEQIGADRILIRRFFDQTDPTSGVTIPYAVTTHIVVAAGIAIPPPSVSTMPRSYLTDVTNRLYRDPKNPVCAHFQLSDIKDAFYHQNLADYGVHDFYSCPISDIDGSPIGILHAAYISGRSRPSDEVIFSTLMSTSIRIAGYVSEVTAPEKKVWYRQLLSNTTMSEKSRSGKK